MHEEETGYPRAFPDFTAALPQGTVRTVLDGRTLLLESGEEVRLAGLASDGVRGDPERAAALLSALVPAGSRIRIQDASPGAAFVYIEDSGMFVNDQAVASSIARVDESSLPSSHLRYFQDAEEWAREDPPSGEWSR